MTALDIVVFNHYVGLGDKPDYRGIMKKCVP